MSTAIFWFRRDLRLHDNHGLYQTLSEHTEVLPIFIFDKEILENLPKNDARVHFIWEQLQNINKTLAYHNSELTILHDSPKVAFEKLLDNKNISKNISAVYTNEDYEPYAISRDLEIKELLNQKNIAFHAYKDHVFFAKEDILKADGKPYLVYTPYKNKWKNSIKILEIPKYKSERLLDNISNESFSEIHSLNNIGFEETTITVAPYLTTNKLIADYEKTRNFPALRNGTSRLGPHLRFGTVSVREMIQKAIVHEEDTFLSELIWREFFIQILWHFPHTTTRSFKPAYDAIEWRNDLNEFELWKKGKTGYPLVDAGMRELNKTGYMHNRVRMLVGSFLCKHLLIDWKWGEAYFAEKLLDYECASNVGNWQWVAGTGVDAAPYFRIFNPTTQIQKFDKQQEYIRKWVPEWNELTYPKPMVDHKMARERCLSTYKKALGKE